MNVIFDADALASCVVLSQWRSFRHLQMTSVVHSQNVHAVRDARNGPNTIDVLEKSTKAT